MPRPALALVRQDEPQRPDRRHDSLFDGLDPILQPSMALLLAFILFLAMMVVTCVVVRFRFASRIGLVLVLFLIKRLGDEYGGVDGCEELST